MGDDLIPGWNPFGGGCTDPEEQQEYRRLWDARNNGNPRYERVAQAVAEKVPPRSTSQQGELLTLPTLEDFIQVEEPGAGALVGTEDAALIPEDGDIMFYGDGGAGKTTLAIDLACHLAAGDPWLALPVSQQSNVLLIENEGARPLFRAKLRRKSEAWTGSPLGGRIRVFEHPWAWFSFADGAKREALATKLRELEIDVLVVGPVTRSGMDQAGTYKMSATSWSSSASYAGSVAAASRSR